MEIGAQFYTIRDFCQTPDALEESIKKVADIGYRYVQISGTCEYDASRLQKLLDQNGLKCVLTHAPDDQMQNDVQRVIAAHDVLNCRYIGLGWHDFAGDGQDGKIEDFVRTYKPVAEAIKKSGKLFMYHNHASEFIKHGGKVILEHISERFLPDELGFTLDTYWVQVGGGNPAEWLERLSGRVPCIHLKDYAFGQKMAVLGEGNINFDKVFEKASAAGTEYMLVEQDDCYGEDPFDCLKRSYAFLKSRGF